MFTRREKPKLSFQIRQLIWPNMGLKRYMRYFALRIVRLAHMPEPLARAIACGLTVSFFPLFGVHALMGFALALLIGAHPIAAAATALIIPPVILPLLFSLDFLVGKKILRYFGFFGQNPENGFVRQENTFVQHATEGTNYVINNVDDFLGHFTQFFLPALIGAIIFMLLVWPASYMAAHKLIEVLDSRHKALKEHRAALRARRGKSV